MLAESAKNLVPKFFDETGTTYDGVVSYGTLGKDKYWKRKILEQISDGDSFLDLACGTGILTREIAEKFPSAKIVGIDITKSYLDVAKQNSNSFDNISFILDDAEKFKLDSKFDCITGSYLPKYCDPEILVKNCMTHLKPGGKIILHDFTYPKNLVIKLLWNFFFIFLRLAGYFIPSWKDALIGLPKLIRRTKWLDSYSDAMKKSGLKVSHQYLTYGVSAILTGTK
ncbi:class I SAM-dependent methyltransferase [Marine Group I thaumarchaeote]|uniref:Class I SAM-dependent methyltransferase n=1 Tax=Marine Group I thaumarchaeote TaxID=2511932 RepID=A0A7K4NET2_9ARCH|nr:class I SAM-dependent methyltransferase [Marine Group I thaumarchaeote]